MFNILILGFICLANVAFCDKFSFPNVACGFDKMCIPLSECSEVTLMVNKDNLLENARNLVCGYFHQPLVCCARDCSTPNSNYGKSVILHDCPHLKVNEESTDVNKRKFLRDSYINTSHVCCNVNEDTYKAIPAAPLPTSSFAPLNRRCTTPNGQIANCTHIDECEAYKKAAIEPDDYFSFVNDSFCGYWRSPMICCGKESYYTESYTTRLPDDNKCGLWDEEGIPPWVVLISSSSFTDFCAGVLINDEYVLGTVSCIGEEPKKMSVKVAECINKLERDDCIYSVKEIKLFPLYKYLESEDVGLVLLKLNNKIARGITPICLPDSELAIDEDVELTGIENVKSQWSSKIISTFTIDNSDCNFGNHLRLICIKNSEICNVSQNPLFHYFLLKNNDDRWALEGLFNRKRCYGPNNNFLNAIFVYKFLPWIKSNIL